MKFLVNLVIVLLVIPVNIKKWDSIIEDKDILKPIIAVFPKYAKDMIIKIVEANTKINNLIAQHIINTSNAEYKEMIKMVNQSC